MRLSVAFAVTSIGLSIIAVSPAQGQIPVTDLGLITSEQISHAKSLLQDLKGYAAQLQQLQQAIQQVQWAANTFEAFVHNPNLGAVMGLANTLGVDTSMPINPWALQGLVSGYGGMGSIGGITGRLTSLGGLVNTSYTNDSLYNCHDDSFSCVQSSARASSNAGIKGMASQIAGDLQAHLPVLQGLRTRLATATTPKDVADIQAQIQVEQTWVNSQQGQLQSVALLSDVQQRVSAEQQKQKFMSDIDTIVAARPN